MPGPKDVPTPTPRAPIEVAGRTFATKADLELMPKGARPMPVPTGRRRRVPTPTPSFPKGAALVAELQAIAARHAPTQADVDFVREHVGRWRREVLGEPGPMPTGAAGAVDAPPCGPIGRTSS